MPKIRIIYKKLGKEKAHGIACSDGEILIDVLKGVKDAGSEMYATSKVGLAKAVDFAVEQAPIVVQELLISYCFSYIWYSIHFFSPKF